MQPRMSQVPGNPIWFDLASSDPDASLRFYSDVIGWDYVSVDMGGGNVYHLAVDEDRNIVGIGGRPCDVELSERASIWLTHLYVPDAREYAAKVVELGGRIITEPHDIAIPGQDEIVGARCTLANPAGGVFSVWQSGVGAGCGVFGEVGTACWIEYHSPKVDASMAWHKAVFGVDFEPVEIPLADGDGSVTLNFLKTDGEGESCAFVQMEPEDMLTQAPFWMTYFMVADIEAATEVARRLGAEVPFGIRSLPFGRYVAMIDPQDAVFSLWQPMDSQ